MELEIILGILAFAVTCFSYYLAIKNNIVKAAEDAINKAEDTGEIGIEKLNIAVNQVYQVIPLALKPVFPRSFIEQVVQEIFDKMEEYARKQGGKGGT